LGRRDRQITLIDPPRRSKAETPFNRAAADFGLDVESLVGASVAVTRQNARSQIR
jgi:hypothetical protein